jgi:DNA-binding XRE family transcriptional regulator
MEQGKAVPSLQVALLLAEYFGCTVDELFELQAEKTPEISHDHALPNGHLNED